MTDHYTVVATYVAKPEHADRVGQLLPELAAASRDEPGNLLYRVARDLEVSHRFTIHERYVDSAAFQAHRHTEHFQRIAIGLIVPLLDDRQVVSYSGAGDL